MRILMISSMYKGFLDDFRSKHPEADRLTYEDHSKVLMDESTEFVSSYKRAFCERGLDAISIISNEVNLQNKWASQYNLEKKYSKNLLLRQINFYKPDILWVEDLRYLDYDTLREINRNSGLKLKILYHCAPLSSSIIKKLKNFDHVITCTPGLVDEFRKMDIPSSLVYHGFDKAFLKFIPSGIGYENNVVFSGSLRQGKGYHSERIRLLDYLLNNQTEISLYASSEDLSTTAAKKVIRGAYTLFEKAGVKNPEKLNSILEYGAEPVTLLPQKVRRAMKKPVYGIKMYELLSRSRIVLNNHGSVAGDYAGNMRMFEVTGAGSCLVTDNKSNITDLFIPGEEIVVYNDEKDCMQKIAWLLENEPERKKIAEAGQRRTLKSHTVSLRCETILEIINQCLKTAN